MKENKIRITNLSAKEINTEIINQCIEQVLVHQNFELNVFVDVSIVSSDEIREINKEYREKDVVTDVLSFPMQDFYNGQSQSDLKIEIDPETGLLFLGDILICYDRAYEQAEEYGHSIEREMGFLTTHSMFHLFGFDHEDNEEDMQIMRDNEEDVLEKLQLKR